jgi:hypothetical protein
MSRHVLVLAALSLLLLSTTHCQKNKPAEPGVDVTKLEELPKESAAHLKRIPNTDLIVSEPPIDRTAPQPIVKPEPKQCMVDQNFYSQVLFPVTVCTRNPNYGTVLEAYNQPFGNPAQTSTLQVRTFKLSSFEGVSGVGLFCHQTSGPFYTVIAKHTDCSNISSCQMVIQSVPQCPQCGSFLWFGDTCESSGRPTQVQFIGPLFAGPQLTSSCGGLSDCGDNPAPSPPVPAK